MQAEVTHKNFKMERNKNVYKKEMQTEHFEVLIKIILKK